MELLEVSSSLSNKIAALYVNGEKEVSSFFDYPTIYNQETYQKRAEELTHRQFKREELVEYLTAFHKKFDVNEKTYSNINKLLEPNSVVVIGGQQAGLLTGPLYTIHKIISIIKFAQMQEQSLNRTVLPVFWVAGEDHDFAEINHTYVLQNGRVEKKAIKQKNYTKRPASSLKIDKKLAQVWIEDVVGSFGETVHTKELLQNLLLDLEHSDTYVDFFIQLIFRLFPNQGLIVVDSGDEGFRNIGSPLMEMVIRNNEKLGENVLCNQLSLKEMGLGEPIEINEHNAHLFYLQDGERVLLERYGSHYTGKNNECKFEEQELVEIAKNKAHLLSNNVATRPLMQEFVFPTLAFISGPGEVAYWAVLNKAFHLFDFKVPPVVPRFMMSIVERKTNKYMKEKGLNLEKLLVQGCEEEKEEWLKNEEPVSIEKVTEEVMTGILAAHRPMKDMAMSIDPSLQALAEKNAEIIQTQILFLKKKIEKTKRLKYHVELAKFDYMNHSIKPLGVPQERIWNIFYYINAYGFQLIDDLLELDYKWNQHHKVIFI